MNIIDPDYQVAAKLEIEARLQERTDPIATASYIEFSRRIGLLDPQQADGYKLQLERQRKFYVIKKALHDFENDERLKDVEAFIVALADHAHMDRAALRRAFDEYMDDYLTEFD